jgi:NAD(P)-dependent dehydrogenase (short-subunit alcohol dehydrogenase family)
MITKLFDLTGKTAIVTGAQRGLGQIMAKGLNESGANIVITDVNDDFKESLSLLNNNSVAFKVDITKDIEVRDMIKRAEDKFGSVDILVNNAGLSLFEDTFNMTAEEFTKVFDVNVLGMFLCCRAVFEGMKKRGYGKIINIASEYGMFGIDKSLYVDDLDISFDLHSYTSSKGAVINLTRDLACYWGRFNINVNAISPGMILTEVQKQVFEQKVIKKLSDRTPMKRTADPSELIGGLVFLASDASGFVNGHNLVIDGGWACW